MTCCSAAARPTAGGGSVLFLHGGVSSIIDSLHAIWGLPMPPTTTTALCCCSRACRIASCCNQAITTGVYLKPIGVPSNTYGTDRRRQPTKCFSGQALPLTPRPLAFFLLFSSLLVGRREKMHREAAAQRMEQIPAVATNAVISHNKKNVIAFLHDATQRVLPKVLSS